MSRYLISFGDGSKDHIPVAETLLVAEAVHAVLSDARVAGVWIFGAGLCRQQSSIVSPDGEVSQGISSEQKAVVGGLSLGWAGRFAKTCRCNQARNHV